MASTFGAAPARRLSASCFQPSPVVGGVSHAVRSGCAMICCSSGLTVSGTGMVFAGTWRGASGAGCANAAGAASRNAAAIAARRIGMDTMACSSSLVMMVRACTASRCRSAVALVFPRGGAAAALSKLDRRVDAGGGMRRILCAIGLAALAAAARAEGQINVICSVQAEWCNMVSTVYARTTGTRVNMSLKGSGEALAQLIAEHENPKTDLWFGGTGDPHLQAAEQGLTLEYKSPSLAQLHDWAQQQARQSGYRTVGIYSGPLGFGYNPELLVKKKLAVPRSWADLLKPEYKGEIQVANPASSGTAYTMVATLVQLMGEDKAFDYMKALHRNVGQYTRSGTGPIKAVARGETAISISFVHDGPGEKLQGFPVETVTPSEGTGAEIGSM